jgi:transposase-like protein
MSNSRPNERRKAWDSPTRQAAIALVLDQGKTRAYACRVLRVPSTTLSQWIQEEERARWIEAGGDAVGSAGQQDPHFLRDLRDRLEERAERNAQRPPWDFYIDLLGDPPPGRSALEQRSLTHA